MEKINRKVDSKFPPGIDYHNDFRQEVRFQKFPAGPDIYLNLLLLENQHQYECQKRHKVKLDSD